MHEALAVAPPPERPVRLWPAVVLALVQVACLTLPFLVELPAMVMMYMGMWGPMLATLGLLVWWLIFSRVRLRDRLLGLGFFIIVAVAAGMLRHSSMGMALPLYGLPAATVAVVLGLVLTSWLSWPVRRVIVALVVVAVWGGFLLLRTDGVDGRFASEWRWRWSPTAEELFQAEHRGGPAAPVAQDYILLQKGDWPGFRGPDRDGRLTGVRLVTDWKASPPKQRWRKRIGPGWSSFAVVGHRVVTQEQRGEDEAVVCYHADTGEEIWVHTDPARFSEPMAGPGPRATPTFHDSRFYTYGARGNLNCLDAATGKVIWTRDVVADSGATVPIWGYSSSPLIADGIVSVFAGADGKAVLGYRASDGELVWSAPAGKNSYCSTQLARLGGTEQLLLATEEGLTALEPRTGKVLWEHAWLLENMPRVAQPAVIGEADLLLGTPFGNGTRRLRVNRPGETWSSEEVWTSRALSPYYNDLVVHKGHAYGFEQNIFTCMRLEDGKRRWRDGRYGAGQALLLADQDLLFVISEKGEAILVEANPDRHVERARFPAIEGKTWNHPVIARGRLFVRNGAEIACYELKEEGAAPSMLND